MKKLSAVVDTYIEFKRSLGMRFIPEGRILQALCKAAGDVGISDVEPELVQSFINGRRPLTCYWHQKFSVIHRFYQFAISRGYATTSPIPTIVPKRPEAFVPYIYTAKEFRALLQKASQLRLRQHGFLQGNTFRMLLLLLWGTGLRVGEALRLKLSDTDLPNNLLTIYDTKFFKSRLVPMDPRLTAELLIYLKVRRRRPRPDGEDSVVFATKHGTPLCYQSVAIHFRRLCDSVGVRREGDARNQPRLHDIRHSFASHRLVSWYQQGADVQRLLPSLATYLGHVNLASTQCYLTATPELLREACLRYERYASLEVTDD